MFRKIIKFILPALIFISFFTSMYSQGMWYTADSTIYEGDSVILHIEEFRGDIQWQRSFDLDVWDSIPGAHYDSLKMVADTSSYFRAKVTEGTCNPIFSDTIHLNIVSLTVTTSSATDIIETSATVGGNVTDDGGLTVTDRGIFYGTTTSPETSGTKLQIGSGTGVFSTSLTGLTTLTTYYIKAYATNSEGTTYGNEILFITNEDFESYTVNTFPSSWTPDANATDESTNFTDGSISYNGIKSLRLHGTIGGCWSGIAYHPIPISPPYEIEIKIMNSNESLSGCHPNRATFAIREGTNWSNPARLFFKFNGDGTISGGNDSINLGTYNTLSWYIMKIRYEIISQDYIRLNYWINGNYLGDWTMPIKSEENRLTNINLSANEGTVWFDEIKITKY